MASKHEFGEVTTSISPGAVLITISQRCTRRQFAPKIFAKRPQTVRLVFYGTWRFRLQSALPNRRVAGADVVVEDVVNCERRRIIGFCILCFPVLIVFGFLSRCLILDRCLLLDETLFQQPRFAVVFLLP